MRASSAGGYHYAGEAGQGRPAVRARARAVGPLELDARRSTGDGALRPSLRCTRESRTRTL